MGCLLLRLFEPGYRVSVISREPERARREVGRTGVQVGGLTDAGRADVCVLSVPMGSMVDVAGEVARHLRPGSLLADIASVKAGVTDRIAEILPAGVEYVSLHPLFGPGVRTFRGERIVAITVRDGPRARRLLEYLKGSGLVVSSIDPDSHDRIMARVQALHHFAYLCLCTALFRPAEMEALRKFSTHSLRSTWRQMKSFAENLDSLLEIQALNPYAEEARRAFCEEALRLSPMDEAAVRGIRRAMALARGYRGAPQPPTGGRED